jgi:hypothetical protein
VKGGKKYFCRKGYHAMNMIALADGDARILYYSARHSGSTHDSLAVKTSPLQAALDRGELPSDAVLLGDDAFSGNHWQILCPFPGGCVGQQDTYNFYQSSLRMAIERAYEAICIYVSS